MRLHEGLERVALAVPPPRVVPPRHGAEHDVRAFRAIGVDEGGGRRRIEAVEPQGLAPGREHDGAAERGAGRDDDAGREFRAALAMLRLGSGARIGARPPVREPVPEPTGRFALSGHETPDEMRELALLLRDGADKIKWNGALLVEVLGRLRAERETLEDLRALETPRDGPAEGALAELDGHIGQVTAELERLRRLLGGFLARANILEQQADREEVAMLQEAGRAATGVAP